MADFYEAMSYLDEIGGFDVLLPFLLVFTLVFAVLQKIKLFGKGTKKVNAIVALVIAIFFLQNTYLVYVLQRFLPNISIILVVFLMFLLILGIFGGKSFQGSLMGWAFIVSLVAVVIALLADVFDPYGGGFFGWYEQIHPGTRSTLWILLIVVVFVMFLMKDDSADKKGFLGKIAEDIKKIEED